MPNSQSRAHALAAALRGAAQATPAAAEPLDILYREAWGYGVVVPVRIQGLGPFDFLLDTGTDVTVVRDDLAAAAGPRVHGADFRVSSVAGQRARARRRRSTRSTLGGRALGPLDVLLHDMARGRRGRSPAGRHPGTERAPRPAFTIDHARRRVILDGPPLDGAGHPQDEGRPSSTRIFVARAQPLRLALDSGIGGLVLFEGASRLPLALTGLDGGHDRTSARRRPAVRTAGGALRGRRPAWRTWRWRCSPAANGAPRRRTGCCPRAPSPACSSTAPASEVRVQPW